MLRELQETFSQKNKPEPLIAKKISGIAYISLLLFRRPPSTSASRFSPFTFQPTPKIPIFLAIQLRFSIKFRIFA